MAKYVDILVTEPPGPDSCFVELENESRYSVNAGDMKAVISDFHKARLAVINLGPNPGLFQSGAYAINDLLKPASVIFTHVNEAATEGGKLRANTQTAALMKQVKAPAYLAISERTMEFDGKGKCVFGC